MGLPNLSKIIEKGVAAKGHSQWPTYDGGDLDRSAFVTSSEIGDCARKVRFSKIALQESDYSPAEGTVGLKRYGFAERGHNVERWVVENLLRGNDSEYRIIMVGDDQRSFYDGAQSGTPDGIILMENGFYILEFKSMDPRTNTAYLPKPKHKMQVLQNMDLVSVCLDKSPLGGIILYMDASDFERRLEYFIEFDEAGAAKLQERADIILETENPEDLPAEGVHTDDCRLCDFRHKCSAIVSAQTLQKANVTKETLKDDIRSAKARLFG